MVGNHHSRQDRLNSFTVFLSAFYPYRTCSLEMEAHTSRKTRIRPRRIYPTEEEFTFKLIAQVPTDPSRDDSPIVVWFAKPIQCAQFFDKTPSALEDSTEGE
jgi:hypothetical protein